jgi:PAS domain S-box-containing protein
MAYPLTQKSIGIHPMVKRNTENPPPQFAVKRFLIIWIALSAATAAGIWAFYLLQTKSIGLLTLASERQAVELSSLASTISLATIRSDVLYLADRVSSSQGSATSLSGRPDLATDLLAFATHKGLYDQIRFIGVNGKEIIRINRVNDRAMITVPQDLQNKSHRYYVSRTLALKKGEIYVSPLDLNMEERVVQQPYKPMIRFGTPVFDTQGHLMGVVVVNYLAQRLMNQILAISRSKQITEHIWLLNSAGYWLLGPHPKDEWGFMFPDRANKRLGIRDPAAWAFIQNGTAEGQFHTGQGLYTYAKVVPYQTAGIAALGKQSDRSEISDWILVAHVPTAILDAQNAAVIRRLSIVFAILVLVFSGVAWAVAFYSARRRWAEGIAHASEVRFRAVLESAPDAIVMIDHGGLITLANEQTENYFGYTRNELLDQAVETLVPEYLRGQQDASHAHPQSRALGADQDLIGQRKDGSRFPVEISLSPLQTPQGNAAIAIIRDVSARREAERLRAETQARYQELMNNLPVGVFRSQEGINGRFLEVNPAMLSMFEADSLESFLALPARAIYQSAEHRRDLTDKIVQQGSVASEECEMITMTGRAFWAAISAAKKLTPEGAIYFDGILEDITQRKAIESQLQQLNASLRSRSTELEAINHELEAFSYSVSHDLRSPLRAIDGFSRILLSEYADRLDDVGRDRLDRVRRAAQHMGMLIDDLLKLSRVSRADLTREAVDLSLLAQEIGDEQQRQNAERAVQFTVAPELIVQGDKRLLRIVLDNLLGNAWKFTSATSDARIEVGRLPQQDGPVVCFVRDNGAGFDMAYADKLFGVFQRLHDTREFPGTGIGLATVQRIIHKHGGRIWAESAVNLGAVFYFILESESYDE